MWALGLPDLAARGFHPWCLELPSYYNKSIKNRNLIWYLLIFQKLSHPGSTKNHKLYQNVYATKGCLKSHFLTSKLVRLIRWGKRVGCLYDFQSVTRLHEIGDKIITLVQKKRVSEYFMFADKTTLEADLYVEITLQTATNSLDWTWQLWVCWNIWVLVSVK